MKHQTDSGPAARKESGLHLTVKLTFQITEPGDRVIVWEETQNLQD